MQFKLDILRNNVRVQPPDPEKKYQNRKAARTEAVVIREEMLSKGTKGKHAKVTARPVREVELQTVQKPEAQKPKKK